MSSGFDSAVASSFRGEFARVVSNDGQIFQGWVEDVQADNRHVLLRDAVLVFEGGTDSRGAVLVAHADSIEKLNRESAIARAALGNLRQAPWHTAEFDVADHQLYVDEVRREGWASSFPVVRQIQDERRSPDFEIVEGHKRLWAAAQAGLDAHPVEIVELDDFEAAGRFVCDHFPARRHVDQDERHETWYDDEDVAASIEVLIERFGADVRDIDRITSGRIGFNAERLGIDVPQTTEAGGEVA